MTVHVPSRARRAARRGAESARSLASRDDTRRRTETDARDDATFRMCIATNPSRRDDARTFSDSVHRGPRATPCPTNDSSANHRRTAYGSRGAFRVPSLERCRLGRVAVAVVVQGTERERRRMRLRRRRIRVRLRAGRGDFRGGVQRRKRRDGDWERRGLRGWIPERASQRENFRVRALRRVPRVREGAFEVSTLLAQTRRLESFSLPRRRRRRAVTTQANLAFIDVRGGGGRVARFPSRGQSPRLRPSPSRDERRRRRRHRRRRGTASRG